MHPTSLCSAIAATAFALVLGACSPAPARVDAAAGEARLERIDRVFSLDPEVARVAVDNPWGEINVRDHARHEVGMHAVVQRVAPRDARARFESRVDGDTLYIEVHLEGLDRARPDTSQGRADIALYIPRQVALLLRTDAGRIATRKRDGAVEAHSRSGEIQAASRQRLVVRSGSGQVRAMAIGERWTGASEIETDSGRVVVLVPTFGDVTLDARTGGRLRSGFGLSVHAQANGVQTAHADYGRGGSILRVRSRSGEIVLEQLIPAAQHTELREDED
ncbi:MAG TPA: hypothetical protein VIZ64_03845 [Dokdonella sp.]